MSVKTESEKTFERYLTTRMFSRPDFQIFGRSIQTTRLRRIPRRTIRGELLVVEVLPPLGDNLPDCYCWRNSSESVRSKECANQNHFGHTKVNDESSDIGQSRHTRSRGAGRIEAAAPQNKWQHRTRDRSEGHNAKQAQRNRKTYQQVILSIGLCHGLPDNDSEKPDGAEQAPQSYSRHQLAADYAPPVSEAQFSYSHGTNDQGGGL
jgi:hypothetical protein